MGKTRLWLVTLKMEGEQPAVVVEPCLVKPATSHVGQVCIRSISPKAAARRFMRNNLATALHCLEDGANEPEDLVVPNPHNHYNPRREKKSARHAARGLNPLVIIRKGG